MLIIPALAFLVVAGLQANLSVRQSAAHDEFADQLRLSRQVTLLVHELQFERDWAAGQLATARLPADERDPAALAEAMAPAQVAVAQTRTEFDQAAAPLRNRPSLRVPIAGATAALDALATVRVGMAEGWLREQAVLDGYNHAIEALHVLLPVTSTGPDPVQGLPELARFKEITAQLRGQVYAVVSADRSRPQDENRLAELRTQRVAALEQFRSSVTASQLARFDEIVRGQAVRATDRLAQELRQGQPVAAQQWWSAATTELELIRELEVDLLGSALAAAEATSQASWRQTVGAGAIALVTVILSLGLSVAIGRSMVRSLRLLRRQAVDVAQIRLPGLLERLRTLRPSEPIPEPAMVSTAPGRDEVAEVAEAFTEVHRSAVTLAIEQAQLRRNANQIYVNLARRSQILVERQLELLDELERDETDAGQLANLFRLDHLATRMRRNNESLLVLTGSDPMRRPQQPVQLAAVALAAVAEIERYQRVRDQVAPDLYVASHVAGDLVHMLAELLDNATAFSAPEHTVMLTGRPAQGAGGALIEITDRGIGLPPPVLAELNATLTDPPQIDAATSVRMGLVVVAHLAARHGIQVGLASTGSRTTATVWLPPRVLVPRPADPGTPSGHAPNGDAIPPADATVETVAAARAAGRLRHTPVRAEDVLGSPRSAREQDSVWWARPGRGAVASGGTPAGAPAPVAVSATPATLPGSPAPAVAGGRSAAAAAAAAQRTRANGLPIRVPLAQLPAAGLPAPSAATPAARQSTLELDPSAVGGTLSSLYGGIHRAEHETGDDQPSTAHPSHGGS